MELLLNRLGVPPELQAYFNCPSLRFRYGTDLECFTGNGHIVPLTANLWLAGNDAATELVITSSAMEAIAFLTLNRSRYPALSALSFIAVGQLPDAGQLEWIREGWQKRKITLVFAADLTGRLTDITVAAGIRQRPVRLRWDGDAVLVSTGEPEFEADPETLTLNSFEKAAGIRTRIRTRKPLRFNTFLDQLKYESNF